MTSPRASASHREQAVAAIRDGWVTGALSTETFERRLDLALAARDRSALHALTHDLRQCRHSWRRRLASLSSLPFGSPPMVLRIAASDAELTLGRHRSCSRIYDDDSVSRRHAALRRSKTGLRLSDLGSMNGTWLNGVRVTSGARVLEGDEIRLGRVRLRVVLEDEPEPSITGGCGLRAA